jgi:lysozyme
MPMPINVVIDISHHNGNVDLNKAKEAGILGVIHKATQGIGMFDSRYEANRQQAQAAELLWGAYHFGTKANGAAQADFFLSKANADSQTLLVLDYEPNGNSTMTLDQARAFVARVKAVTGRFPTRGSNLVTMLSLAGPVRQPTNEHSANVAKLDALAIHGRRRRARPTFG